MKYTTREAKKYIILAIGLSSTFDPHARNTISFGYELLYRLESIMNNPEAAREDNLPDILNQLNSRKSDVKELLSEYKKSKYKKHEKALEYFSKNFKNLISMDLVPENGENKEKFYKENKHVKNLSENFMQLKNLKKELNTGRKRVISLIKELNN